MDRLLELLGALLASAYAIYGFAFLLLPMVSFGYVPVLAAVVWAVVAHSRGRRPFPKVPEPVRGWTRFALEVSFGLVNPVIYLVVLARTMPALRDGATGGLEAAAWVLLAAFWGMRLTGAALDPRSRRVHVTVRLVLWAALACVLLHGARDLWALFRLDWGRTRVSTVVLGILRLAPLYLVPALLLWDYLRAVPSDASDHTRRWHGLFVLPGRAARAAVVGVAALAIVTVALAGYRRSDVAVRGLVNAQRDPIQTAASQYDVDPRLLAAIVYVAHRDDLSPFRDALERVVIGAWASNLRGQLGMRPPDRVQAVGTDENPLLNRALDISVGLAQVKPRTAQTASVLATGLTPDELPEPVRFGYRDVRLRGRSVARGPVVCHALRASRHRTARAARRSLTREAVCGLAGTASRPHVSSSTGT